MRRKKTISITDVAKRSGVSIATVSRVMNNFGNVSDSTRQRVMEAIEQTGYEPCHKNTAANSQSNVVLVTFPDATNDSYKPFINGLHKAAEALGARLIFAYTFKDAEVERQWHKFALSQHLLGVIAVSPKCDAAEMKRLARQLPLVQCYDYVVDTGMAVVCVDDEAAGFEATNYLINKGHRRIALFTANEKGTTSAPNRAKGYMRALKAAGIPYDPDIVYYAPFIAEEQEVPVRAAMAHANEFDAIFCVGDMLAARVAQIAQEKGIRVPEDLSVIGFDDNPICQMTSPKLTSVSQNHYKIGYYALKTIYDQIQLGESMWGGLTTTIDYFIVERESVCDVNKE